MEREQGFLSALRSLPPGTRRFLARFSTGVAAIVIFVGLGSFIARDIKPLNEKRGLRNEMAAREHRPDAPTPSAGISDSFGSLTSLFFSSKSEVRAPRGETFSQVTARAEEAFVRMFSDIGTLWEEVIAPDKKGTTTPQ